VNSKNLNISLLVGAGISYHTGIPKMDELTNHILNGIVSEGHTDYIKNPNGNIIAFLNIIKDEIIDYYKILNIEYNINYESIFDVIDQIDNVLRQRNDNPAISQLIKKLLKLYDNELNEIKNVCHDSILYIKSVLLSYLNSSQCPYYFNIFEKIQELSNKPLNIFTLNHDNLLENFFGKNLIKFIDGFEFNPAANYSLWNPNLFDCTQKIKLLKLHGSISWYRLSEKSNNSKTIGYAKFFEKPMGYKINLTDGKEAEFWEPIFFLTGINNKYLDYNSSIFLRLFYYFQKLLDSTNNLIVSGYSFGDNGINLRLIDWFINDSNRKLIIICPNKDSLISSAKGAMQKRLKDFPSIRLKFIPKCFEKVTIEDINEKINEY